MYLLHAFMSPNGGSIERITAAHGTLHGCVLVPALPLCPMLIVGTASEGVSVVLLSVCCHVASDPRHLSQRARRGRTRFKTLRNSPESSLSRFRDGHLATITAATQKLDKENGPAPVQRLLFSRSMLRSSNEGQRRGQDGGDRLTKPVLKNKGLWEGGGGRLHSLM